MFLVSTLISGINRLLPFTNPQTPLLQDIIHALALCTLLYYAPQLTDRHTWNRTRNHETIQDAHEQEGVAIEPDGHDPVRAPGAFQEDSEEEDIPPEQEDRAEFEQIVAAGAGGFVNGIEEDVGEGPADAPVNVQPAARPLRESRTVGAKKAKSLARKDQRRAYYEFLRYQGEIQRAQDAEGAAEREEQVLEEKRRRAVAEMKLEEKLRKEREERKAAEQREREMEWERQKRVLGAVRDGLDKTGASDLRKVVKSAGKDVDLEYVERLVKTSGLLGKKADGELYMLTTSKWVVKVNQELVDDVARKAAAADAGLRGDGKITWNDMGELLEEAILVRSKR